MTPTRRHPAALAALALFLAFVACSSDGEPSAEPTSTTGPTPSTAGGPKSLRPAGAESDLGRGVQRGLSPDGTAVYVADVPETGAELGCEGMPADVLYRVDVVTGERVLATPEGQEVSGEVLPRPGATPAAEVAVVDQCEGFLVDVYVARATPGGALSDIRRVPLPEQAKPGPRLAWTRDGAALLGVMPVEGVVVRIDPATGRTETVRSDLPGASQAAELADGTLVVLAGEKLRLGDREEPVPGARGFSVDPAGRNVAVFGGALTVVGADDRTWAGDGRSHFVATWSPDGEVVASLAGEDLEARTVGADTDPSTLAAGAIDSGVFTPDGKGLVFSRTRSIGPDATVTVFVSRLPVERK